MSFLWEGALGVPQPPVLGKDIPSMWPRQEKSVNSKPVSSTDLLTDCQAPGAAGAVPEHRRLQGILPLRTHLHGVISVRLERYRAVSLFFSHFSQGAQGASPKALSALPRVERGDGTRAGKGLEPGRRLEASLPPLVPTDPRGGASAAGAEFRNPAGFVFHCSRIASPTGTWYKEQPLAEGTGADQRLWLSPDCPRAAPVRGCIRDSIARWLREGIVPSALLCGGLTSSPAGSFGLCNVKQTLKSLERFQRRAVKMLEEGKPCGERLRSLG